MRVAYEPDGETDMNYGYVRCAECGVEMFGGGPLFHASTCSGDGELLFVIGKKAGRHILKSGEETTNNLVVASDLRRDLSVEELVDLESSDEVKS